MARYRRFVRRKAYTPYRRRAKVVKTRVVIRGRGAYRAKRLGPNATKGQSFGSSIGKSLGSASVALGVPAPLAGVLGDLAGKGLGWLGSKIGGLFGKGKYTFRQNSFAGKNLNMGIGVPYMHTLGERGLRIRRREFCQQLGIAEADAAASYLPYFGGFCGAPANTQVPPVTNRGPGWNSDGIVNPSNPTLFPWLSQIVNNKWQEYRFLGLGFFIKTFVPSSGLVMGTSGVNAMQQIYMGVKYNAGQGGLNPIFNTFPQFGNTQYSTIGKLSEDQLMLIECAPKQLVQDGFFVDNSFANMTAQDGDRRFLDMAVIEFGLVNPNASESNWTFGELYVIYDILLSKPQLNVGITDYPWEYTFVCTAAGGWWTDPDSDTLECEPTFAIEPCFSRIQFKTDGDPVVQQCEIWFNDTIPGGGYDVELTFEGTTATTADAFANGTVVLVDAMYMPVFFKRDGSADQVAHVGCPKPADVTTGVLRVTQRFALRTTTERARAIVQLNHAGYPAGTQKCTVTIRQFDPQDNVGTVITGTGTSVSV